MWKSLSLLILGKREERTAKDLLSFIVEFDVHEENFTLCLLTVTAGN